MAAGTGGWRRGCNRLADPFSGEHAGRLRDRFEQQWMLSQRIESVPAEEMARRGPHSPRGPTRSWLAVDGWAALHGGRTVAR